MTRKRRSSNTSGEKPKKARKVYEKDTPETQVYEVEQILGRRDKDGVGWYISSHQSYNTSFLKLMFFVLFPFIYI